MRELKCSCYGVTARPRVYVEAWAHDAQYNRRCTKCGRRLRVWHIPEPAGYWVKDWPGVRKAAQYGRD
jgi:hypothetical protein